MNKRISTVILALLVLFCNVIVSTAQLQSPYKTLSEFSEEDFLERFEQPEDRLDKRSVAISRLHFRPGKRSADSESEISMIPSSYDINNSVMEDDPTVVESAQKRSVAVSRKNFRPAKRSAAFGRLRFRPAKRSAAFGRLRFRPAKRAETEWY